MQKIPLSLAKPGMVLEKPVARENGIVLIAQGTEISEMILERLERMDIQTVVVEGQPVDMEGLSGGTDYAARAERLEHLFRRYKADPWMGRVKKSLADYFRIKAAADAADAAVAGRDSEKEGE